jgi:acyl-CoA hydrolase
VHLAALSFQERDTALIGITDPHHRDGLASSLRKRTAGKAV